MGLLDNLFNPQDPTSAAKLQAAFSLLGQQGFGNAGMAGLQAAQQFRMQQTQQERQKLLDQLTRYQLDAAGRENQIASLAPQFVQPARIAPEMDARDIGTPGAAPTIPASFDTQGYLARIRGIDPMRALQMEAAMQKQAPTPIKLGAGDTLVDPTTFKPLASAPKEPDKGTSDMQEFAFAVSRGEVPPGMTFTQWLRENKRAGAANVGVSYGSPVQAIDAAGNPVFIQPAKDGKAPYVVPGVRPPMSAAEERAAAEKATRARQGEQMLTVLNDAESILKEGNATGSGLGTVADAVGRSVGVTTKGAIDSSRLQAMSGWLVANVPRMEGPQSNYDVQNYMTMAGKVGDSTVPIKERLAALAEVRKLQQKYAAINGTPVQAQPDANKVRKFNPATGRIE